MGIDTEERTVILFTSEWSMNYFVEKNPKLQYQIFHLFYKLFLKRFETPYSVKSLRYIFFIVTGLYL